MSKDSNVNKYFYVIFCIFLFGLIQFLLWNYPGPLCLANTIIIMVATEKIFSQHEELKGKIKIGMLVYHKDIYDGHEQMKVVGLRESQIELEGDYSGGTHNVCQKGWESIDGILIERNNEQ